MLEIRCLKNRLECMVVNILVHIERFKYVKSLAKVNISRNGNISCEDREKVCAADHRIDMNNRHEPISIAIKFGLNNPHAVVRIRVTE